MTKNFGESKTNLNRNQLNNETEKISSKVNKTCPSPNKPICQKISNEDRIKVQSSLPKFTSSKKDVNKSNSKAKKDGKSKISKFYQQNKKHSLSSQLQVEYMQASVFTGSLGNIKPFNGFPDNSFVSELRGVLDERLMKPAMTRQIKNLIYAAKQTIHKNEKIHKAKTTKVKNATKKVKVQKISGLTQERALTLYRGHREALTTCNDDLSDLIDAREPLISANRRANVALAEYHQRQQTVYNEKAAAFVGVCIHTGLLKKANTMLVTASINKSKNKARKNTGQYVTDVKVYNTLLHAWAAESNYEAVDRLVNQMRTISGITLTLQSYAAILESLGRKRKPDGAAVREMLQNIQNDGLDINRMTKDCIISEQQWYYINKSLREIKSDVQLATSSNEYNYNNELLDELNDSIGQPYENPNFAAYGDDTMSMANRLKQQLEVECVDKVKVQSIESKILVTPSIRNAREKLNNQKKEWRKILTDSFLRNRHIMELKAQGDPNMNLVPFLRIFDVDTYVDLMMQEIDTLGQEMAKFSPTMSLLQFLLGRQIFKKFQVQVKAKKGYISKVSELYSEYLTELSKPTLNANHRQIWQAILDKKLRATSLEIDIEPWSYSVSQSIGKFMYRIILADVKIDPNQFQSDADLKSCNIPAFYAVFRQRANSFHEEIKPHPVLVKLYRETGIRLLTFEPSHMPLLTPPLPWTSIKSGGSLLSTTDLVRHTNSTPHQLRILNEFPNQKLFPIFDALNTVSSALWRINKPILDMIIDIFNSGGDAKLDVPRPSSAMEKLSDSSETIQFSEMDAKERQTLMSERKRLTKERKEMFSLWCTELYRLSIANKYRDEIFCFPHNLDFRGRVYACPPHFNHLGSDLARSILVFAKGKPLGEKGYDWLKIHLVNLTGLRKRSSNVKRLEFANEIIEDILDSAKNPMNGKKWWQNSDEPWQTLACCLEIAKVEAAINAGQNAADYICHLPIHQDGSCNGLQHYATLGRDQAGAESVNLCPFESPKDVYSDVVEKVELQREIDAASGNLIAQSLEGFVKRKVIKQTIMTTVYGVTQYGAREQIRGQLSSIENFPQNMVWDSSFYLTEKTFNSLQEMFTSTKLIQDWFVLSAKLAAKISLKPMQWETPIGWPIVQPYFRVGRQSKPSTKGIKETHESETVQNLPHQLKYIPIEKPNSMKQRNAFPPNFIHSLDSTHMMLTGVYCLRQGLTFVSVHDCFWTHASDVEVMNSVCRKQFVALHSRPILDQLSGDMLEEFGVHESNLAGQTVESIETIALVNHILSKVPERGIFDVDDVLRSTYFFS